MIDYDKPDDDPIVAEVRAAREALAMQFNGDLKALFEHARKTTEQHARAGHAVIEPPAPGLMPTVAGKKAGRRGNGDRRGKFLTGRLRIKPAHQPVSAIGRGGRGVRARRGLWVVIRPMGLQCNADTRAAGSRTLTMGAANI